MTTLNDQPARERITSDYASTLFVEAGAGAGKTKSLVDRIVGLLKTGTARAENIAAITFTNRAAGEMKERVQKELEKAARVSGNGEEHERLMAAIHSLDAAAIETIHSFSQRLLKSYALEAGLPPTFRVTEIEDGPFAFDEWWDETLDTLLSDNSLADAWRCAVTVGVSTSKLRSLAQKLNENWDRVSDGMFRSDDSPETAVETLKQQVKAVLGGCATCGSDSDKLFQHIQANRDDFESLQGELDTWNRLEKLLQVKLGPGNRGSKASWGESVSVQKDRMRQAEAARLEAVAAISLDLLSPLLTEIASRILKWADWRRRDGSLTFHDLLVLARDLIRESKEAHLAAHNRYTHILIDEFQDTDPLQLEIATMIASEQVDDTFDWRTADIAPGRLMFVGDPKQSIYRFRRADVELFREAGSRAGVEQVTLSSNFRSHCGVIEWVNELFETMIDSSLPPMLEYQPIDAASRRFGEMECKVQLFGGPVTETSWQKAEADAVRNAVCTIIKEGWPVADGDFIRSARLSDIAILFPTRNVLGELEFSFKDAGIPYRVESQSLAYNTVEAHDVISILKSVNDPTNQATLVAALRGSGIGCGDDDLYRFKMAGGKWSYLDPGYAGSDNPVVAAMARLRRLHQLRFQLSPGAMAEAVMSEFCLPEIYTAGERRRESWGRLRFVADQARAFSEKTGGSLAQFLDWWDRQQEADIRISESVLPEMDDDAVRILTVHAAKGLEFPIVIVCGLGATRGRNDDVAMYWDTEGQVHLRFSETVFTGNFTQTHDYEKLLEDAEKIRLLYVAATRAESHLLVSAFYKATEKESSSMAARVFRHCNAIPNASDLPFSTGLYYQAQQADADFNDSQDDFEKWCAERQQLLESFSYLPAISATLLAKEKMQLAIDQMDEKDPQVQSFGRSRGGGTSTGRAVHAVLQSLPFDADASRIETTSAAQAAAEGMTAPGDAALIARFVKGALSSGPVSVAQQQGVRSWREVFVSGEVESVLLEGFVDLMYQTPDGRLHIVDYKTDGVANREEAVNLMRRYSAQGAAYAIAAELASGLEVADVQFVFTAIPEPETIPIEDLEGAKADVRSFLRQKYGGAELSAPPVAGV